MSMQRVMLRAKLHRVTVTQADLHYDSSCGIDQDLLDEADIWPNDKIELYTVNNGERFATYAIPGSRGSGEIPLDVAAARRSQLGDLLTICTDAPRPEARIAGYEPKIVFVDGNNTNTGLKK